LLKAPFNSGSVRAENWALPCGAIDARVPLFFFNKITAWMKHCMTQYDYLWKYMKMTMTVYDYDILWLSDSPDWRWFNGKKIWHYDQCDCKNKDIPIITDACFSSVDLKHS
jgi:hypothetical protein